MTFIPSVLSQMESNNSINNSAGTIFQGTYTSTTGYNTLQVSVYNTNVSGTLEIYFSPDGSLNNISKTLTDTYSPTTNLNENFTKRYDILDKYYKIQYTSSQTGYSVNSRLCTDSINSENNSISVFDNNTEYTRDAFGKLRVTNPTTILDLRLPYILPDSSGTNAYLSNNIQLTFAVSGTGNYTTTNNSNLILSSGSGVGYCISQSRNYCTYLPGKSMLIKASCIMDAGLTIDGNNNTNGVTSRVGYFDDYNGLYFQYVADGTGTGSVSVNLKNNAILSASIPQTNWNIDKMNGTGTSGIYLDFTKAQLFIIDFEWLGVGRIRFGFYVYGKIIYCHEILNVNSLTNEPYMSSSNLPIRCMIQSGVGETGSMIQICSTVISEGGYNPIGRPFSIANTTGVAINNTAAGELIILMIRGGSTAGNYYHQTIVPYGINLVDTGSTNLLCYRIRLYKDGDLPSVSAITWNNVNTNNSIVQYSTTSSGLIGSNSIIVNQGFFSGKGSVIYGDLSNVFDSQTLQITSNYSNVSDILVITAQMISGTNSTIYADINWNEFY
jgi:hypothetical protein